MIGKIISQMFRNTYWSHSRPTATVGNGECLVQINMDYIGSKIYLSTISMNDVTDFFDAFLENTMS